MRLRSYKQNTPKNAIKNIHTEFREAFEGTGLYAERWDSSIASGDIAFLDGNALGLSYYVISKSPLSTSNESYIETTNDFQNPVEAAVGFHMSQRTVGQEVSIELVDTDAPDSDITDVAISAINQTTTTVTVDTATAHGLVVGKCIGIRGAADSRFNYPQLVVASTPSTTQFTCTAGPSGTIASLTASTTGGFVYFRERLGRSKNGMSLIFENATTTNASAYIRSDSGDALPSGTSAGSHSMTVASTSSVQAVNAAYNYAFSPTSEFRLQLQTDRCTWIDSIVDAVSSSSAARLGRSQVCPDGNRNYKLRIRTKNLPSMPTPVARIVSISKSGTTTATVTTDVAHGLSVNSYVAIYGVNDQTNFANLTTATVVASIVSSTSFTIILGSAVTATSYGGYVSICNGTFTQANVGAISQVAQSVVVSASGEVSLTGNASWSGLQIGDTVQLHGVNNITTGAPIVSGQAIDGAYKITNIVTTVLSLVPIDGLVRTTLTSTNCGGGVIKRTDIRLSYVRVYDYDRVRIESIQRGSNDVPMSLPVTVTGFGSSLALTTGTSNIGYTAPQLMISVQDIASAAITSTATTSAVTPAIGSSYKINIPVTSVSGTSPTMDVSIEESDDSGTNWYKVYDFPRITGTGIYRSPPIKMTGNRIRYVQTIGGTSPSFTRTLNRLQLTGEAGSPRQLIDRTISLTTLNSTTPTLITRECVNMLQLVVSVGAITTTAPAIQLEGSEDGGATWYSIGSPLTAVASSTVISTFTPQNASAVRARVSTAGVGVTANYIMVKGGE